MTKNLICYFVSEKEMSHDKWYELLFESLCTHAKAISLAVIYINISFQTRKPAHTTALAANLSSVC